MVDPGTLQAEVVCELVVELQQQPGSTPTPSDLAEAVKEGTYPHTARTAIVKTLSDGVFGLPEGCWTSDEAFWDNQRPVCEKIQVTGNMKKNFVTNSAELSNNLGIKDQEELRDRGSGGVPAGEWKSGSPREV